MALTKDSAYSTAYAIASTASNDSSQGSAFSLSSYYDAIIEIFMGRGTGTAFTTAPTARVELSPVAAATPPTVEQWTRFAFFQAAVGATLASQAYSSGGAPGANTVTLAAGTNFSAGDDIFVHNTTLANSEWQSVESVSSATLTIEETFARQVAGTVRDQAERYVCVVPAASGVNSGRITISGAGSGQAVIYYARFFGETGL